MESTNLPEDFIAYIRDVRGFAPATIRTYMYVLSSFTEFLGNRNIQELSLIEVDNYIAAFCNRHNLKPSSSNTVRCVLRAFFMYVDRYRGIRLKFEYSMIRQTKAPRSQIVCTDVTAMTRMLKRLHTPQDKLMMLTMFSTGMRISELVNLTVEQITGEEIRVRGKGAVDRVIPIDARLATLLSNHIREHQIYTGVVFRHQVSKDSLPNGKYTVSGLRKRWQRQLGELYKRPHSLRHGVATGLLMQGMDIRSVQTFLGHSHIGTTMLYTHITDKYLQEAFRKYSPTRHLKYSNILDS